MLGYEDTSALIALYLPSDMYHRAAAAYLRENPRRGGRFAIGRPVLVEYFDGLTKRKAKREAIEQLHFIDASAVMRVERDTDEDHAPRPGTVPPVRRSVRGHDGCPLLFHCGAAPDS